MIKDPKHGWCTFQLGDFVGNPSYLTDVPVQLLDAFLDYHEKGIGAAVFDEEGSYFTFLLTKYNLGIFIIEEKEEAILHDFSAMDIEELEKELITDIERDFQAWVNEFVVMEEDTKQHEKEISEGIKKLKEQTPDHADKIALHAKGKEDLSKTIQRLQGLVTRCEYQTPDDPCKVLITDEIAEDFQVAIAAMRELQLYRESKLCLIPENVFSRQCEELDAYKEIGTIAEVRDSLQELKQLHEQGISMKALQSLDFRKEVIEHINYNAYMDAKHDLEDYQKIGTLEEVQDAIERQRPKKVMIQPWSPARCPRCGKQLSEFTGDGCYSHPTFLERCPDPECAQRLDWNDVSRG